MTRRDGTSSADDLAADAGEPSNGPRPWIARLQSPIALLFLLGIFFWQPLVHYASSTYCFADFTQMFGLVESNRPQRPSNRLMGDPAVQFHPWVVFNRRSIRSGEVPLWNPWNGNGVPQLANLQSAVFSPFSVPFYLLPLKAALIVSPLLKLLGLAGFTYLFLRLIKVRRGAALAGACGFGFAGFHVIWLHGPHVGSVIVLPAGFYFVERYFRSSPNDPIGSGLWNRAKVFSLLGLALSVAAGILAGHPETFCFSAALVAIFMLWRARDPTRRELCGGRPARIYARLVIPLVIASAAGIGLAAAQIVPFGEYLAHSSTLQGRQNASHVDARYLPTLIPMMVFPNLFGSPTGSFDAVDRIPSDNYAEQTSTYVGAFALFLFLYGFTFARRDRRIRFFLGVFLAWAIYAFGPELLLRLIRLVPGIGLPAFGRSAEILAFVVACGGAIALDGIATESREETRRREASVAITLALAFLALPVAGAALLLRQNGFLYSGLGPGADAFRLATPHIRYVLGTFALGVVGIEVLLLARTPLARKFGWLAVLSCVFLQGGFLLRDFNPTVRDQFFYPRTEAIDRLARDIGPHSAVLVDQTALVADANMMYEIPLPSSYDALWIAAYDRLYRNFFGADSFPRSATKANRRGLELFGIEYALLPTSPSDPKTQQQYKEVLEMRSVDRIGSRDLHRFDLSLGPYYTVALARRVDSEASAFRAVLSPYFDPYSSVILGPDPGAMSPILPAEAKPGTRAAVLSEQATRIRLRVERADAGYLVLARPFYPGWKARVDGRSARVLRANFAFSAIPVGPGRHDVEFWYEPLSWRVGLGISLFTLSILAIGMVMVLRNSRLPRVFVSRFPYLLLYGVVCAAGTIMTFSPTIWSGFAEMQADQLDTLLNNYILEHAHRVFFFLGYVGHLWSPPSFFPVTGTLAYGDNLFGTLPIYSGLRLIASPLTAFQLWLIVVSALTFASMAFLLRSLGIRPSLSAFGAFAFAYGMPRTLQTAHAQLLPQIFSPLALLMTWRFLKAPGRKPFVLALAFLYLQALAGIYLGWLTMFGLGVFILCAWITGKETFRASLSFFLRYWLFACIGVACFCSLLFLTFRPYLRIEEVIGTRAWSEVTLFLPNLRSWISARPGSFYQGLLPPERSRQLPWENELFIGAVFWVLAFAPRVRLPGNKPKEEVAEPFIPAAWLTFGVIVLLTLKITFGGAAATSPSRASTVSLWWLVYHAIPGAQAIRAVSRIWTVAYLLLIPAILLGANEWIDRVFRRRGSRVLAVFAILCFGVGEQYIRWIQHFPKADFQERVDAAAALLRGAGKAGYLEPPDPSIDGSFTNSQLVGMWAGLEANVPIINGYNGNLPPRYLPLWRKATDAEIERWVSTPHGEVRIVPSDMRTARDLRW